MKDLSIKRLKNTSFVSLYSDFILNRNMCSNKYMKILALATIFLNSNDEYIKHLGYRMIIIYSNQTNDYKPLYEVAINLGMIPIAQFIQTLEKYLFNETIFTELNSSFFELYHSNNVYYSEEQKELIDFYYDKKDSTISIIAPTSYGKTDLILSTLRECKHRNICIITPTKSLLAQTKMRIINSNISWINKIITHPEMYNGNEDNIVAVLTQERLLRLLKNDSDLSFDYVIIDEAHGLLNGDERSTLLASVLIVLEKRNKNIIFKFLTPFLCDAENLKIRNTDFKIDTYKVSEYVKTERLYIYDIRGKASFCTYDHFLDDFYDIEMQSEKMDDIDFIERYGADKNLVYLNKPTDVEGFALRISNRFSEVISNRIEKACKDISEYIHPQYNLISCLKKGVIYHHGAVPEPIRLYIEKIYSDLDEIKYVITNCTLLEGVNLPAEKMFILDNKKGNGNLSPSNLKNLIGRICRFSEIFNMKNKNLIKLEPCIFFVVGQYYAINSNVKKFLKTCMKIDREVKDKPMNVLLTNTNIDEENSKKLQNAEEFIENYERGIIENYDNRYVTTLIGEVCFSNNVKEINIFSKEEEIQKVVDECYRKKILIDNTEDLFNILYLLFFKNVEDNEKNQNLLRFKYTETRNFYKMFLDWRIESAPYSKMVSYFVSYWNKIVIEDKDTSVYMGRWGEEAREGVKKLWVDIKYKSSSEKVNLAVVRIKDEQDFLDNTILKYIEVLNDIKLIDEALYLKIKYGTDDKRKIILVKNGISLALSNLLIDNYMKYVKIDLVKNLVILQRDLIDKMFNNQENEIMISEANYFIK
ncbi:DEAD/DEAH box helicase [Clostridium sp. ZBS20]|uniref:DEAD/DEAH box helicase n=1 Tax=Clostridium sp. ZBS20 TaxID=2949966 RepID=UPI00207A58A5|nr:DEAD/DEAH box helicase [Clostridium sp. ZBS20]